MTIDIMRVLRARKSGHGPGPAIRSWWASLQARSGRLGSPFDMTIYRLDDLGLSVIEIESARARSRRRAPRQPDEESD